MRYLSVLKPVIALFLLLTSISAGSLWFAMQTQTASINQEHVLQNEKTLSAAQQHIHDQIDHVINDAKYLSHLTSIALDANHHESWHDIVAKLSPHWLLFSQQYPHYWKLRLLDLDGQELLRINQSEHGSYQVADQVLENKTHRYYVQEALDLKKDEAYLSPLDLNVENGQIELPIKPVIRVAVPVFDPQGHKRGIIIITYLATDLLHDLQSLSKHEHQRLWLVNEDGYWLMHDQHQYEWGFMYKQTNLNMNVLFPQAWYQIQHHHQGDFNDDTGLWTFTTMAPAHQSSVKTSMDTATAAATTASNLANLQKEQWKLIAIVDREDLQLTHQEQSTYILLFIIGEVIFLLATYAFGAWRLKEVNLQQRLQATNQNIALENQQRQQAEVALSKSLSRYHAILAAMPDSFWLLNQEGFLLETNPAYAHLLGVEKHKLLGKHITQLPGLSTVEPIQAEIMRTWELGAHRFEIEQVDVKGTKHLLEVNMSAIYHAEQACAILRDITQQKEQQAKLRLAASVFVHANEGILIADRNHIIIDVNDAFTRITGYEASEAIGQKPSMLSSGRHDQNFYDTMYIALAENQFWTGEVWNRRKSGEIYPELLSISAVTNEANEVHHYVALFSDITLAKQQQRQLERVAHYDLLTNLPNRLLLNDRMTLAMAHAVRHQQRLGVIFLDLDGFKAVNDNCGHDKGDQLLIDIANALRTSLRAEDTVSRFGGDEFVLLITGIKQTESIARILENILQVIHREVRCNDQAYLITASIGVTFFPQSSDIDADQLIRQADQAMYIAKEQGKNTYFIFDAD